MSALAADSQLHALRERLVTHPLYSALRTGDHVRIFMQHHVFCVWDFMSLLKALQRRLTCVEVPWTPVADPASCRLVNEIVLGEESDEDGQGGHCSHFELYLAAMRDAGASTRPIDRLLQAIRRDDDVEQALRAAEAPPALAAFVRTSLDLALHGTLHDLAAGFALGREDVIPEMFLQLLEHLATTEPDRFGRLLYYLRRHVQVDADSHGPAALQLVERLCDTDAKRAEATATASRCLRARLAVWDEILRML